MSEYFVVANSFAAPFCSDQSTGYAKGDSPDAVLLAFAAAYKHPAGLYSADLFASADAYHKNEKPLAKWRCNRAIEEEKATKGLGCYVFRADGPDMFTVNDVMVKVADYKAGRLVA